jgi:hypothetical protein
MFSLPTTSATARLRRCCPGLHAAEVARLPHQAQRTVRLAAPGRLDNMTEAGRAAVTRLSALADGG